MDVQKKICNLQNEQELEWKRYNKIFQSWWETWQFRAGSRYICLEDEFINCGDSEDWEKAIKLRDVAWLIWYRTFEGEARDPLWTMPFLNIQSWFKRVIILVMTANCWSFQREKIEDMNHFVKEFKLLHSALMERAPHQTARARGHKKKMCSIVSSNSQPKGQRECTCKCLWTLSMHSYKHCLSTVLMNSDFGGKLFYDILMMMMIASHFQSKYHSKSFSVQKIS